MSATGGLDPRGRRAFDVFVSVAAPQLRRVIHAAFGRHRVGHLDVDDLLQTVYERLLRHYDRFDNEVAAYAYARRIAITRAVNARRNEAKRDTAWLAGVYLDTSAEELPAEAHALARIRDRQVRAAVHRLPLAQRRAVVLVDLEQWEPSDAAAAMGTTPDSVKGLLQRGRQRLRKDLLSTAPGLSAWLPRVRRPGVVAAVAAGPVVLTLSLTVLDLPHLADAATPRVTTAHVHSPALRHRPDVPARDGRPPAAPAGHAGERGHRAFRPHGTGQPPSPSPSPLLPGGGAACVGETCAGERLGDRVCVHTGQEGVYPVCANQRFVGVCPLVLQTTHVTCRRDSQPMVEPPPIP